MPNIGHVAPFRLLANIEKFGILPPLEADVVDSMSPPHPAEYVSAQLALAQDSAKLQLIEEGIEDCRARIARLHAQMHLLEHQRDAVQHRMSIHQARLSPLRNVPDQVLQEIFQHCLPDTRYVAPNARFAPLVLTHVCRRWRAVVQGTSELWSSIALCDRGVWNYELEVEMVKRWLDRSRMRSIRMAVTCPSRTDFGLDGSVLCSDIFRLAIAHSAHLDDLYLNVNRTYLHHFLNCANLPLLRSLAIHLHSTHRIDELLELDPPDTFSTPNLRRIAFKGDGVSINLIPRTVFPQITHLSFDCNTTLDIAHLFQDFPRLEHLTLTLSLARDALRLQLPPRRDHQIAVPSLRCLEVSLDKDMLDFGDPGKLGTLLDHLALPALHTLILATPLRPRFDARTGHTEARWENHAEWVHSPSVASLLSRSRNPGVRLECHDLVSGDVQVVVFDSSTSSAGQSFTMIVHPET